VKYELETTDWQNSLKDQHTRKVSNGTPEYKLSMLITCPLYFSFICFGRERGQLVSSSRKIPGIARAEPDGTRAEIRFRLSPNRTGLFKSVGASVQSTAGSRGVRISLSNAG